MEAPWWLTVVVMEMTVEGDVVIVLVDVVADRLGSFLPVTCLKPPLGTGLWRRKIGVGKYWSPESSDQDRASLGLRLKSMNDPHSFGAVGGSPETALLSRPSISKANCHHPRPLASGPQPPGNLAFSCEDQGEYTGKTTQRVNCLL